MNLIDLRNHINNFPQGTVFKYGLSEPFSWRGRYNEVAFNVLEQEISREDILSNIGMTYSKSFHGWKGGEYSYGDNTEIHFEESYGSYTDGDYAEQWIAKIEGTEIYKGPEDRLTKLLFK